MARRNKLPKWAAVEFLDMEVGNPVTRVVLVSRPAYCNELEWGCRTIYFGGSAETQSFGSAPSSKQRAREFANKRADKSTFMAWRSVTATTLPPVTIDQVATV